MERAASICTKHILGSYYFESALIICGPGNNGGDGLVIARLLAQRGIQVTAILLDIGASKSEDFQINLERLPESVEQLIIKEGDELPLFNHEIIIDAIFGSGLSRGIDGWVGSIVDAINSSNSPRIAVDLPSGIFTDQPISDQFKAVKADKTITFQCPKMCFFFPENDAYVGEWSVVDIGLHPDFQAASEAQLIKRENVILRKKHRSDHKGTNGFLSILAGVGGMPGAAILASKAAFRTGCGYVGTTAANEAAYTALISSIPELLLIDGKGLALPKKTDAIVVGPGIGTKELGRKWLGIVLEAGKPLIIDADGINVLADNPGWIDLLPAGTILSPHIGELKRLIGEHKNSKALLEAQ